MEDARRRSTLLVAALFVVLTLVATYPIVRAPASYVYFDHPDAQLNMWIMAWDAHALRTRPLDLFNTNIFYPAPRTLAYSETLLGYLPIFGPILWLHGSPVLAFNMVLLFSFAASGFSMYLLAEHLTGRIWPSIAAGIAYAFVPYRFVHIPQIQLEAMEWFPLAFLSLHLFVERRERKYAAAVAICVLIETLCCVYYGVFLAIALVAATGVLALVDARMRRVSTVATLAVAAILASIVALPLIGEYARVHDKAHLGRSLTEIADRSATAATYLASAAPIHLAAGARRLQTPRDYLFPGLLAILLAAAGTFASRRRPIMMVYIVVGALGMAASFGPNGFAGLPVYSALHGSIWFLRGLRQVSRFGVLTLFAIAVLVATGCSLIESTLPRRHAALVMAALSALLFLETFSAPLHADRPGGVALIRAPSVPDEYTWLARQPGRFAVVEFPVAHSGELWRNASYVYWSTTHWHGLVNGYSGFASSEYASLRHLLTRFPDDLSHAAMTRHNVRYVVIHWDRYKRGDEEINVARLNRTTWLRRAAQFPNVEIFENVPDERQLTRADR